MSEILLTQEVGSLAKPSWRVQPLDGLPVTDEHIADAADWAVRLGLEPGESTAVLQAAQTEGAPLSPETQTRIRLMASRYAIRTQEVAGLDILYDGEQDRTEMYQDLVSKATGFETRGRVRAFDNKSYLASAVIGRPGIEEPGYDDEFARVRSETDRIVKVPITGAYTVADWSFDEFYEERKERGGRGLPEADARRAFVLDVADRVVRPNIASLIEAGAEWIQIDEPAATTKPDEVELFVESFNRSVAGLPGKFSVHICFAENYDLLFPHVSKLEGCSQFSLELANRDTDKPGTDAVARPGYQILRKFKEYTPHIAIGTGVVSVHDNVIETVKLVRDRVECAVDIFGDPTMIFPSPDCGLRTRRQEVSFNKMRAVVEGTGMVRKAMEGA